MNFHKNLQNKFSLFLFCLASTTLLANNNLTVHATNIESNYFVTIPKQIVLSSDKQADYTVQVTGNISSDKQVHIEPTQNEFALKDQISGSTKADVEAVVTQNKTVWKHNEVADSISSSDNKITTSNVTAGNWKGTFEVSIALEDDPDHVHSYTSSVTKEPTCAEEGIRTYTCECGNSYTETIAMIGHNYKETVTAPTCGEEGYTTHTCANCGDSYVDSYVAATGLHQYTSEIIKEASCTENGIKTFTCECGNSYTETIAMIGHNYISTVTKQPNCTEEGIKTFTCSNCSNSYTENLPASGEHNMVNNKCTICGMEIAPSTEYSYWNYTLDETAKTITLNYYKGSKTDVTVFSNYEVNGTIYTTRIKSNETNSSSRYMFAGKTSIKNITFSEGIDTSTCTNMSYMFYNCSSLTNLDVSNLDTSNVTDMMYMFYNCSKLAVLDVSNFNTSNVTNVSRMFNACKALTSLDVNNFDTSNVIDMEGMFYYCTNLISLDLRKFDTSNATNMRAMFMGCKSLANLDVSNFDTSKVTDMYSMFGSCSQLTSLDISNFDTSNVTDMMYMFNVCSGLTSLDISNFDTRKATNMNHMFSDCSNLTTIYVANGKWDTANATTTNMFYHCGISEVTYK